MPIFSLASVVDSSVVVRNVEGLDSPTEAVQGNTYTLSCEYPILSPRYSCTSTEHRDHTGSPSSAEKCSGREQRTGHWSGLHSPSSALLVALLHRFAHPPLPESPRHWLSLSSHRIVFHHLHPSTDEFSSVHLAIVVLHERMASDKHGQVADGVQAA